MVEIDYLRDYRFNFWSPDFLDLMVERWGIRNAKSVLEVGCGRGHWIISLLPHLNLDVTIWGIDKEEYAVRSARELIMRHYPERAKTSTRIIRANGDYLPFREGYFDVVTCQTYLMHQSHPDLSIRQMIRLLKAGGTLICAEPNNFFNYIAGDAAFLSVEERVLEFEFWLRHQQGREIMGKGYNAIGERLHDLLSKAGLSNVQTYISDRCSFSNSGIAPKEACDELRKMANQKAGYFDPKRLRRFVTAGGGSDDLFERGFSVWLRHFFEMLDTGNLGRYMHTPGSMYLSSGRKEGVNPTVIA